MFIGYFLMFKIVFRGSSFCLFFSFNFDVIKKGGYGCRILLIYMVVFFFSFMEFLGKEEIFIKLFSVS